MATLTHKRSIQNYFADTDTAVPRLYRQLVKTVRGFGVVREEAQKNLIALVNRSALVGVEVRKNHLLLHIKTFYLIHHPRILKTVQVAANRFQHQIKVAADSDIDAELCGWLKDAYQLSR
jgi:hypothetical protein